MTSNKKYIFTTLILLIGLLLAITLSIMTGRYLLPPGQILDIILNEKEAAAMNIDASVVWNLRIPRILLNILVGDGLAITGTVFQGIFRNPLVSPDILGVSSGAAFGAALGILISGINIHATAFALVFRIISVCLTYSLARLRNEITPLSLVLSGMIISAIFSALISLTKYIADPYDKLPAITYWLMGRSRHIGTFSVPNDKDYEIVTNVLEKVGISSLASKKVTNINGGQLQLVLIAKALASEPQLLVMDEPESYFRF
ncbi:iron chelate uptake ABC transporter family permease subunit [Veillonella caviae]|uniref:iron chelate uptake ABC transporter family permease subunit n=2 Tax=Veillonella caviae TaxID=248316 RepID=UPI0023F72147|nr:iron chelate uptake ABC transporter family permease subunit [Veillonella caviae]